MFDIFKKKDEAANLPGSFGSNQQNPFASEGSDFISNMKGNQDPFAQKTGGPQDNPFGPPMGSAGEQAQDKFNPDTANHFAPEEPEQQQYNQYVPPGHSPSISPGNIQSQQSSHSYEMLTRSIDLLNTKLDAIRFNLDSINQRLANIERIAYEDNKKQQW